MFALAIVIFRINLFHLHIMNETKSYILSKICEHYFVRKVLWWNIIGTLNAKLLNSTRAHNTDFDRVFSKFQERINFLSLTVNACVLGSISYRPYTFDLSVD